MKNKPLLPLFLTVLFVTGCSPKESKIYCFDTYATIQLYDGKEEDVKAIEDIFYKYDKLTDNYHSRDANNIYTINHTNDPVEVDEDLYTLMDKVSKLRLDRLEIPYFSILLGTLTKKWKEAIANNQTLDYDIYSEELLKMLTTEYHLLGNNTIQRTGESEIDLGAVAKGYTIDIVKKYLDKNKLHKYIINAGSSSILLGEKNNKSGLFNVGLEDLDNAYLKLKNCVVSTSSISKQSTVIDGVTYSHIVNPKTGNATTVNDAVVVIRDDGLCGDALSTGLMNCSVEEIKEVEKDSVVKVLVINDGEITYKSKNLEVYYH